MLLVLLRAFLSLLCCVCVPLCLFVCSSYPLQEEMYSFVSVAQEQTFKGKGTAVVQDS